MSETVSETKRGQVPSIDVLENKIEVLQNAILRGREAESELPIVRAKLQALLSDPEYKDKLARKVERMRERAARLESLGKSL